MTIAENTLEHTEVRTPPSIKVLFQQDADLSRKTVTEFLLKAGIVTEMSSAALAETRGGRSRVFGKRAGTSTCGTLNAPFATLKHCRRVLPKRGDSQSSDQQ